MRSRGIVVGLFLLVLAALAQSDRGTITGTVADPAGAVVASAHVEAKNVETGVVYEAATSTTGNYTIAQLPAGTYEVSVAVPGFKRYTRQGLTVQVAQTLRIDVSLEVGAASESVTVTEAATLLKTESGELSHIIEKPEELPIFGVGASAAGSAGIRNPNAIITLIPGTVWVPNSQVRVNGAPNNSQSFRVEGQEAANTGTPGVPAQNQPSVDAIQEVAIQTSNFAAEYGQVGGGVFNLTMKSGTNQFHGTAYDYFVNEIFNAGQPFTNSPIDNPRPRERRHDYGFTAGGPVWIPKLYDGHGRTFFFFNWEQFRETYKISSQFQTVPTAAYRAGDFSAAITPRVIGTDPLGRQMLEGMVYDPKSTRTVGGLQVRDQFPGNKIDPTYFDPVAVKIQQLFPQPGGPTPDGPTNNYLNPYFGSRVTEIPSIKIDEAIGARGRLSFYWSRTKTSSAINTIFGFADGLPDPITTAIGTFDTAPLYRLNYDHTLSPALLLHLGAGYRSNYFFVPSVTTKGELTNYNAEKELGLRGGIENKFFPTMMGLLATNGTGGMKNIGSEAGTNQITQSPSFNASLAWVKGNHTYKFGSEFRTEGYPPKVDGNTDGVYTFAADQTGQPFQNTAVNGATPGFGYASFLLGLVKTVRIDNPATPRLGKEQFGIYAQDSWKVTRKFTLDYGLRYDYSTYLQEEHGRAPNFSPTAIHPTLGIPGAAVYDGHGPGRCGCNISHNYPYAAAPRIGAAYQINSRTVFRMGFGIVYAGTEAHNNSAGTLAGSSASTTTASFGFPVTTLSDGIPLSFRPPPWPSFDAGRFPTSAPVPGPFNPGALMDPNAGRPARQYQWSVGIQREVLRDLVVEAAYVGNRGVWWQAPALLNLNANSPERLKSFGIDINNATDRALLTSRMDSSAVVARGVKIPYTGFPTTQLLAQALRPFPQFTTIDAYWDPLGKSWYDSLQVKATKRASHGLTFASTFSWQKSLYLGSEIGEPNPGVTGNAFVNDVFHRNINKYLSAYDQPRVFNVSVNYVTPKIGGNKVLSWVARDWTYGVYAQYANGMPLQVPYAQNNLGALLFDTFTPVRAGVDISTGTFANRVPGKPLFTVDPNCHCYDPNTTFLLNKDAWVDPPAGQFGSSPAYYDDYRKQRRPVENIDIGRDFRISERVKFNLRMDFNNIFNRAFWADPSGTALTNAKQLQTRRPNGNAQSGFGYMLTTFDNGVVRPLPRNGILVGRFTF